MNEFHPVIKHSVRASQSESIRKSFLWEESFKDSITLKLFILRKFTWHMGMCERRSFAITNTLSENVITTTTHLQHPAYNW